MLKYKYGKVLTVMKAFHNFFGMFSIVMILVLAMLQVGQHLVSACQSSRGQVEIVYAGKTSDKWAIKDQAYSDAMQKLSGDMSFVLSAVNPNYSPQGSLQGADLNKTQVGDTKKTAKLEEEADEKPKYGDVEEATLVYAISKASVKKPVSQDDIVSLLSVEQDNSGALLKKFITTTAIRQAFMDLVSEETETIESHVDPVDSSLGNNSEFARQTEGSPVTTTEVTSAAVHVTDSEIDGSETDDVGSKEGTLDLSAEEEIVFTVPEGGVPVASAEAELVEGEADDVHDGIDIGSGVYDAEDEEGSTAASTDKALSVEQGYDDIYATDVDDADGISVQISGNQGSKDLSKYKYETVNDNQEGSLATQATSTAALVVAAAVLTLG